MRTISEVPSRSLLSRLTDHYMQIIANRAPVGFEAEFDNPAGENICYRGILMPFSSDGETIDFIYGVINWKRVDDPAESRRRPPSFRSRKCQLSNSPTPMPSRILPSPRGPSNRLTSPNPSMTTKRRSN